MTRTLSIYINDIFWKAVTIEVGPNNSYSLGPILEIVDTARANGVFNDYGVSPDRFNVRVSLSHN
jgi:hypothetical protein